jgi:hypothetical protein
VLGGQGFNCDRVLNCGRIICIKTRESILTTTGPRHEGVATKRHEDSRKDSGVVSWCIFVPLCGSALRSPLRAPCLSIHSYSIRSGGRFQRLFSASESPRGPSDRARDIAAHAARKFPRGRAIGPRRFSPWPSDRPATIQLRRCGSGRETAGRLRRRGRGMAAKRREKAQ